jgi:hypothetical protein
VTAPPPIRAIIGPGRSGTTWAGSIIDSCPDVIYRFEPFHRMSARDVTFRSWFSRLKEERATEGDLPELYELLRRADPLVNKAPFFANKSYPQKTAGRDLLWPAARIAPPARWLYRRISSPPPGPPIVFKEVTFIKPIKGLLHKLRIPVVYLVRHPCATVLSEIRGMGRERNPARQRRLRQLLMEHAPDYVERFRAIVDGTDVVSRTALLWRCEVESCASAVLGSERGMLLTYEQLAGDAYRESERMLSHLGLEYGPETARYLDELHNEQPEAAKKPRRTGWGRKYFSVYRNPRLEKDAWKRRITAEEQRSIEAVVQGSPAIERLAALGNWW